MKTIWIFCLTSVLVEASGNNTGASSSLLHSYSGEDSSQPAIANSRVFCDLMHIVSPDPHIEKKLGLDDVLWSELLHFRYGLYTSSKRPDHRYVSGELESDLGGMFFLDEKPVLQRLEELSQVKAHDLEGVAFVHAAETGSVEYLLSQMPNLRQLDIRACRWRSPDSMVHPESVRWRRMTPSQFSCELMRRMVMNEKVLPQMMNLVKLQFAHSGMDDDAASILGKGLESESFLPNLAVLELLEEDIGIVGIAAIVAGVKTSIKRRRSTIRRLVLHCTNESVYPLFDVAPELHALEFFPTGRAPSSLEDFAFKAQRLAKTKRLKSWNLEDPFMVNRSATDVGIESELDGSRRFSDGSEWMVQNASLDSWRFYDMEHLETVNLTPLVYCKVAELAHMRNLKRVNVLYEKELTSIGKINVPLLAKSLPWNTLEELWFGPDSLSAEADVEALCEAICNADAPKLKALMMSAQWEMITDAGAFALAKAISCMPNLVELHLDYNDIGPEGTEKILQAYIVPSAMKEAIPTLRMSGQGVRRTEFDRDHEGNIIPFMWTNFAFEGNPYRHLAHCIRLTHAEKDSISVNINVHFTGMNGKGLVAVPAFLDLGTPPSEINGKFVVYVQRADFRYFDRIVPLDFAPRKSLLAGRMRGARDSISRADMVPVIMRNYAFFGSVREAYTVPENGRRELVVAHAPVPSLQSKYYLSGPHKIQCDSTRLKDLSEFLSVGKHLESEEVVDHVAEAFAETGTNESGSGATDLQVNGQSFEIYYDSTETYRHWWQWTNEHSAFPDPMSQGSAASNQSAPASAISEKKLVKDLMEEICAGRTGDGFVPSDKMSEA